MREQRKVSTKSKKTLLYLALPHEKGQLPGSALSGAAHIELCTAQRSAAQRILGALPHARGPGELPGRGALRALQEPGPPGAAAACPAPAPRPRYLSLRPRNGAPAAPAPPRRSSFPPPLFFFLRGILYFCFLSRFRKRTGTRAPLSLRFPK